MRRRRRGEEKDKREEDGWWQKGKKVNIIISRFTVGSQQLIMGWKEEGKIKS